MIFVYLALLGRIVLLGFERIFVKKLGEKEDAISATFLFFLFSALLLLPAVLLFVKAPQSYDFLPYLVLSSFIYSVTFTLYVKSLSMADASLVSPLYNFNVFFLLVLSTIFLGEKFTVFKVVGLLFLVYGASFLNRQRNTLLSLGALFKNKACVFMMLSSLLLAIGRIIDGLAVRNTLVDSAIYGLGMQIGTGVLLLIYLLLSKKITGTVALLRRKPFVCIAGGFSNAYSYVFLLFAFTQIDVSIAEPVSMLSVIATVLLAHLILKEKIRERLIGVVIMILGAWILFL